MKKGTKILTLSALALGSLVLMSSAPAKDTAAGTFPVPAALETKIINTAVSHHFISSSEAEALKEHNAIQRCADAFWTSNFEPSAAVDELATVAVEAGKYRTPEAAKKAMRRTIDKARKNESNWTALYKICGL